MWAVETKSLSKSYGSNHALVDCDLQIASGCVFGLLGPNGAGKSTLLRTLLGLLHPTRGAGSIAGFDIVKDRLRARQQVAYLPGDARLMRSMRGDSLLRWFSGLHPHGSWDAAQIVAERLELELSRRVMFMSTGMRQKLALSIVLGCQAPIIVLDEPTANLDPNVRHTVLQLIREIRGQGRSVILSSHIFSDIDETCDHVAILRAGKIVARVDVPQLQFSHWVSGRLPANHASDRLAGSQQWLTQFEQQPLLLAHDFDRISPTETRIQLQLTGEPQRWFSWVSALKLEELLIERGGVASIYRRYHHTVARWSPTETHSSGAGAIYSRDPVARWSPTESPSSGAGYSRYHHGAEEV